MQIKSLSAIVYSFNYLFLKTLFLLSLSVFYLALSYSLTFAASDKLIPKRLVPSKEALEKASLGEKANLDAKDKMANAEQGQEQDNDQNRINGKEYTFAYFTAILPEKWIWHEESGFATADQAEYRLNIDLPLAGRNWQDQKRLAARLSIFLLPNKNKMQAKDLAIELASLQEQPDAIKELDGFFTFTGLHRRSPVRGRTKSLVATSEDHCLIILIQDPQKLGAEKIFKSLKATHDLTKILLGQKIE